MNNSLSPLLILAAMVRNQRGDRTQAEYSEYLGISQSQISNWELGRSMPRLEQIEVLAKDAGLSPEQFVARLYGRNVLCDDLPLEQWMTQPAEVRLQLAVKLIESVKK